jgi:hypothetical protein
MARSVRSRRKYILFGGGFTPVAEQVAPVQG